MGDRETLCPKCGGTGKRWIWRAEDDPRFAGWCEECAGTGRICPEWAHPSSTSPHVRTPE